MFGKQIELLTFEDVRSFLRQNKPEGKRLDYKQEMIKSLGIEKLCSAFANSEGGFIVFGVKEDDRLPVPPFDGESLGADPAQTVKQACSSLIPPVEPIVSHLLRNPSDPDKAFLVVAIPQSGDAPHALRDGTVFVKTQDHKQPVQPTTDLYELLAKQRDKSRGIHSKLVAETRDLAARNWFAFSVSDGAGGMCEPEGVRLKLEMGLAYPDGKDISDPQQIIERLEQYRVYVVPPMGQLFLPTSDFPFLKTIAQGVQTKHTRNNSTIPSATTIHSGGAYIIDVSVPFNADNTKSNDKIVCTANVCATMIAMLRSGFRWFRSSGAYAAISVKASFACSGKPYYISHPGLPLTPERFGPAQAQYEIEETVPWPSIQMCREIEDKLIGRYLSSFNIPTKDLITLLARRSRSCVHGE